MRRILISVLILAVLVAAAYAGYTAGSVAHPEPAAGQTPAPTVIATPKERANATRLDNDVAVPFLDGVTRPCVVVYDRPGVRGRATGIWCVP